MAKAKYQSAHSKEKVFYRERILSFGFKQFSGVLPENLKYVSLTAQYVKKGKVISDSEVGIATGLDPMTRPFIQPHQLVSLDRRQVIVTANNQCNDKRFSDCNHTTKSVEIAIKKMVINRELIGFVHLDLMTLPENIKTLELIGNILERLSEQDPKIKVCVAINLQMRSQGQTFKDMPSIKTGQSIRSLDVRERLRLIDNEYSTTEDSRKLKEILRKRKYNEDGTKRQYVWKGFQQEIYHPYDSQTSRFPYQAMLLVKEPI